MSAVIYTGKPCVKCGSTNRYVNNGRCRECYVSWERKRRAETGVKATNRRNRAQWENPRDWILNVNSEPEPNTGCLIWLGSDGGGNTRPFVSIGGKRILVSRFLMDAPAGSVVRHTCDNGLCVNPDHLIVGTQKENIADCIARGRKKDPPRMTRGTHPNTKIRPEMIPGLRAMRDSGVAAEEIGQRVGCSGSIVRRAIRTYDDTGLTSP